MRLIILDQMSNEQIYLYPYGFLSVRDKQLISLKVNNKCTSKAIKMPAEIFRRPSALSCNYAINETAAPGPYATWNICFVPKDSIATVDSTTHSYTIIFILIIIINQIESKTGALSSSSNDTYYLTHWGRVEYISVGNLTIIGSDNGLWPGRRQNIIWTSAGILLIGPLWTNFCDVLIEICIFSFNFVSASMC